MQVDCALVRLDKADIRFLRATAVPAGTAERELAMAIPSVRRSVFLSRPGTDSRPC